MEREHLTEHARHLRGRQGRAALEVANVARQVLVYPVAQLVGERHHVPKLVGEVHQDIRMSARHGTAAERPAPLAGPELGVDPALLEELADDAPGPRTEPLVA